MGQTPQQQKILILAAIPHGLRSDRQIRFIEESIKLAKKRDMFEISSKTAVRPQDIRRAIAEEKPQIVHFCGHGLENGSLVLEDDGGDNKAVSPEALASLFKLHADYVHCVLLNACHSVKCAEAISKYINYVIGMNKQIQDESAIKFAEGFYDILGGETSDYEDVFQRAFDEGLVAIQLENLSEAEIPIIKIKIDRKVINPRRRIGRPFQAPPLPTYYVDRPEREDLKTRLLTNSSDVRTLVVTAIHGLGSVGKSTLAKALAYDEEVQNHFCDGILWITLGQQPNLLSLLSEWVQILGDYNFKPTSVEATSNHLRTLLYDKAVLLVVDDAWNTQDAQALNVGGARCQVLVTTREAALADALRASTYPLDVMTPSQAMELLTNKLGRDITGAERQQAEILAKELGYLPLALELAASQVDSGVSWAVLLQDIQEEIARLKTFDRPGARDTTDEVSLKSLSLTASLNLSIQRLPDETRENFIWLGILPEDVNITQAMTATLWDMDDERDAADELRYLHSKALLLPGVPLASGTRTYRLHDLFHDLALNLLTAPQKPKRRGNLPGLGITLPAAHAAFLEKYRNLTDKNLWHTLPSDSYIHQHLVWHLEKAGKVEEIHKLLAEESKTGGNGWYEACDRLGQTANFVTDVARAWQLAEASWTETTLPQVVGLQCRYALIVASLNSLATTLSVELLIELVKESVWTPEQGLAYVLQSSNPEQKVYLLTKLANHLPSNLKILALSKALAAIKWVQDESHRAKTLSALTDKLPEELLPEALAAAKLIQDRRAYVYALSALADKLPSVLPDALAAATLIQDEYDRAEALSIIADKLPKELLPEVLAAATLIQDRRAYVYALSALVDKLPSVLPDALAAAKLIQDNKDHTYVLNALADKLPSVLPDALAAAKLIQDDEDRARALKALAKNLPPELLPDALATTKLIQDEYWRVHVLSALANKLLPEFLPEVLVTAREIQDASDRIKVLIALADKLPSVLHDALATAREIQDASDRAKVLTALADKLPSVLHDALASAKLIQNESRRAKALEALADKLPEQLLPDALAAAELIQNESCRAKVLTALAVKLPTVLPHALAAANLIPDHHERTHALSALAVKLPSILPHAMATAKFIHDQSYCAEALSTLAVKLPSILPDALAAVKLIPDHRDRAHVLIMVLADEQPTVLPDALTAVKLTPDERSRATGLCILANKLPPELLPDVLTAAKFIQSESQRVTVLEALADKLPSDLLQEALVVAREIQSETNRVRALCALADKLPDLLTEALATAKSIKSVLDRVATLSVLANKMPSVLPEALAIAKLIQDESERAYALRLLADKLPLELLPEVLVAAKLIQSTRCQVTVLTALANKLPVELFPDALATANLIPDDQDRTSALEALAKKLPEELLPEALAAAKGIQDQLKRAYVLSILAGKISEELLPEALLVTRGIQNESSRALVLSILAEKIPKLLPEALTTIRGIKNESSRDHPLRILVKKNLQLLPEALAASRGIQDKFDRAHSLKALAPKLLQIQKTQLFSLWQDALYILSLRTRPDLLSDIKALTPVIFSLGGQQALKDTASAIQDVSRWWR